MGVTPQMSCSRVSNARRPRIPPNPCRIPADLVRGHFYCAPNVSISAFDSWRHAAPSTGARRVETIEPTATTKRRPKIAKVYPPHEHFGSPLNVCRVCGEKYSYVERPHSPFAADKK